MITNLSAYVAQALERPLPDEVAAKTADHILDTLAAMVSGSPMGAGQAGLRYARRYRGAHEARVIGSDLTTAAPHAALANGMSAHADETDDSHEPSRTHPGCAIVPAALAVAERDRLPGTSLLRAVALGYDLCCRFTPSLWPDYDVLRAQRVSTHAWGPMVGSAMAAGASMRFDPLQVRYLLSYTAQQLSGITTWQRDVEHIEKAFVFGGMPAFNGVLCATLVEQGWPGVRDVTTGEPNLYGIFGHDSRPQLLVDGLGERFAIMATNIKRFSVGSPIQAPLQGLLGILDDEHLHNDQITKVTIRLPQSLATVVAEREMPDINLRYLVTVALHDGTVTFASSHDEQRFAQWQSDGGDPRVAIIPDTSMAPTRQAIVEVHTRDGQTLRRHETAVRGTAQNPMTSDEVDAKALDLLSPALGDDHSRSLIATIRSLPSVNDCRDLLDGSRGTRSHAPRKQPASSDKLVRLLADYACNAPQADGGVAQETKRRVVDTLGVALGALHHPGPHAVRRYVYETPVADGCRVWGTAFRTTPEGATLANGAALRCLDYNDAYFGLESQHPSDMISGLIAVAERHGRSGAELLNAIGVAYEVTVSLCDAVRLRSRGWDHVNLTAIGACCGMGRLLGLNPEQLAEGLGITVVPHAAMRQTRYGNLSMWKGVAAADAVRHALYACSLARAGVKGPQDPFQGAQAFLHQLADGAVDNPAALESLRDGTSPRRLLDTHLKAWPVGYVAQSGVQAALSLHERLDDPGDVAAVAIATFQSASDIMGDPEKWRPATRETADHSLPYVVSAALRDGEVGESTFAPTRFADPALHAFLQQRVTVTVDPELEARYPAAFPTRLEVRTGSGETLVEHVEHPLGHARNPMPDTVVEEKFLGMAEPVLGDAARALYEAVTRLEGCPDIGELTALLVA